MIVFRFKRAFVPLFGWLAMVSFGSAQADTFGRTTIGATASQGLISDFKRGSKYTVTQPGTLRVLCAYLDGQGGGGSFRANQDYAMDLYRDSGGIPGERVAENRFPTWVQKGDTARWRCLDTPYVPLAPGDYWIVIHTGGGEESNQVIRDYADGTGNWYGNADAYGDGSTLQFGPGIAGNGTLSAYGEFAPESELRNAGRSSIGAMPSGPLRADFKRGSSFTLSEEGRLVAMSGYFDGLGATSGLQTIRMVLYKDSGGVPGEYLTETQVTVGARMNARWFSGDSVEPLTLPAGKYWIVLHSNGPSVARYYADGAGNWYGNTDLFEDGASNPFGAGAPGNGTITAFITYEPVQVPAD